MKKRIEDIVKRHKLNNEGAALLSVIVVAAFITVLATTMLYITSMNYQMKQTDYQNKKSFYKAEEALDVLRAELTTDMSKAFSYAYQEVMVQYAYLESDTRQAAFNGAFLDYLNKKWSDRKVDRERNGQSLLDELKTIVSSEYASSEYEKYFIAPELGEAEIALVCDRDNGRFVIQNVRVRYAEKGYSSFICTDIAFCVPDLDLEHSGSNNNAWVKPAPAAEPEREAVVLSDYIIFMNWTRY